MNLDAFTEDVGYEVSDENYYDTSAYEEVLLEDLNAGDKITGKPIGTLFTNESEYKSDSYRFYVLSEDDNGIPIKVRFYCNIPKPVGWSPKGNALTNLFRNNKYDLNTYNVIFSILKLQGMKNIYDDEGNPRNAFKNVSAQAYLEILAEQEEITIVVKENELDEDYNTLEIIDIK